MYEPRGIRPLSRREFALRVLRHFLFALGLLILSLGVGMEGYMRYVGPDGYDAFLFASMLLGGMGPVGDIATPAAKIFAGLYALYSGLVFLVVVAILLGPVVHRALHRFHWEEGGG